MNVLTLEKICEAKSSNIAQKDLENNNGCYPIYGASGFIKNVDFYKFEKPYLAIVKDGAGVGRVMSLPEKSSIIGTMQAIIPNGNIDIDYLFYYLKSKKLGRYYTGATIPHIYFKDYKKEEFNIYSLEEQRKISKKLKLIDNLIDYKNRQLEHFNQLIKSQFVEMFENDAVVKKQLKSIAKIGSSKRIYASEYKNSGIPFYRSKEIRELGTGLKPSVELFIDESKYNYVKDKFGVPKKGDILVAAIGATIGYMWIVDDSKFYYKDGNLINISPFDKVSSIYLKYVLEKIINDYKIKNASGSAQLAMTIEKIEKFEIPVPPLELQSKFAHIVEQIDKQKFEFEKSLKKLEELQASLMQEYFG